MKLLVFFAFFVSVRPLLSQSQYDSLVVINTVADSLKEFKLSSKYSNWSIKSYLKDIGPRMNDSFLIEGLCFSYSSTIKFAKKTNNTKIRGVEIKHSKSQRVAEISILIFTMDRRHSIVFVNTIGGGYCGMNEIFILEKKTINWEIVNRLNW